MMDPKDLVSLISKKAGIPEKEIQAELDKHFETLDKEIPEADRIAMSVRKIRSYYRKELSSNAVEFTIRVLGSTGVIDMVKKRIKDAIELSKTNPSLASQRNVVDEMGKPLYNASQVKFEKMAAWQVEQQFVENDKGHLSTFKIEKGADGKSTFSKTVMAKYVGKPLPETDLKRTIFITTKKDGVDVPGTFFLRGKNTAVEVPKDFREYKVMGILQKSSSDTFVKINDSKKTVLEPVGEAPTEKELMTLFNVTLKAKKLDMCDFDEWCQQNQSDFNRFAIMNVIVTDIIPTTSDSGWQVVKVEDDTLELEDAEGNVIQPITTFMSPQMEIDFSERSEIVLIGQPGVNDKGKSISALGIYVPEMFRDVFDKKDEDDESK